MLDEFPLSRRCRCSKPIEALRGVRVVSVSAAEGRN